MDRSAETGRCRKPVVDRHRQPRGLPIGLLGHRLAQGPSRHQHQRRSDRCSALQSNHRRCWETRRPFANGWRRALSRPLSHDKVRLAVARQTPKKTEWLALRAAHCSGPPRQRRYPGGDRFLTQPQAIAWRRSFLPRRWRAEVLRCRRRAGKRIPDRCRRNAPGKTFPESGASYMGFAVSALAVAGACRPMAATASHLPAMGRS